MKKTPKFISIAFSAGAESIAKQLREQGFKYKHGDMKYYQQVRDSITTIMFSGIVSDKQTKIMYQKLFKKIKSHIRKFNKIK